MTTIIKQIATVIILVTLCACTRESDVQKYANKEGWDSYTVEGYCFFGCSKDDFIRTKFVATKDGRAFKGCTCSGIFLKNTTLRLD